MRNGFSLTELLIVIGIIGLLAGMLFAVGNSIRDSAKATVTTQRMQEVVNGLGQLRAASSAYAIQDLILGVDTSTGVRGVVNFASANADDVAGSTGGYQFRGPWGKDTGGVYRLSQFNPRKTVEFLAAAGVCAQGDALVGTAALTDPAIPANHNLNIPAQRVKSSSYVGKTSAAWNDAWGNPLVVAYAIYQASNANLASHLASYGYNRCIYVAVGAQGSAKHNTTANNPTWTTSTGWTSSGGTLDKAWTVINNVANNSTFGATLLSSTASTTTNEVWFTVEGGTDNTAVPPWTDVRRARGKTNYTGMALLTTPVEFK